MKIASWNINSVRLRIDLVCRFLNESGCDILCLQETKTPDAFFPEAAFIEAGFAHICRRGMKGYNGVAICSRAPFAAAFHHDFCGEDDCRHAAIRLSDGTEVHNLYIPSGGNIPDLKTNPKFRYKLDFVDKVTRWFPAEYSEQAPLIIAGDFNIAPLEEDVWSHRQMRGIISHTPIERTALAGLQQSFGWTDAVRHFIPPPQKLYSWWSYRARDWQASDRGRRLDHIWVSKPLRGALKQASVLREARNWPRPSDHVPVIVELAL